MMPAAKAAELKTGTDRRAPTGTTPTGAAPATRAKAKAVPDKAGTATAARDYRWRRIRAVAGRSVTIDEVVTTPHCHFGAGLSNFTVAC